VRGLFTGGEGTPARRPGPGGRGGRGGRGGAQGEAEPVPAPPAATVVGPTTNPLNVQIGNLFYGTEGWAAMNDGGFQAYKGESSELIMEERPERPQHGQAGGDTTSVHMENFLSACR